MQTGRLVEQVILSRDGGSVAALVVLEAPSGARLRERWPSLADTPEEAIDRLALQLAFRGDVDGVRPRLRIRDGRGAELIDRSDLVRRFQERLIRELSETD